MSILDIGVSAEKIKEVYGEPTRLNENVWTYGISTITFDEDGKVSGWVDNGQLVK